MLLKLPKYTKREEKQIKILEEKLEQLNKGKEIIVKGEDEKKFLSTLGLLSIKPKIIVCNVDEENLSKGNEYTKQIQNKVSQSDNYTPITI